MTTLALELRQAGRVLLRQLGVTTIAALTLALAIGATTAIFSVVYGVLLRPLPYPAADRLLAIFEVNHSGRHSHLADPNVDDFRDRNQTLAAVAKYASSVSAVVGPSAPTREAVATVSRDFFRVLGVTPALGRSFTADDAHIGAEPAVLVSTRYWTESLGSSRALTSAHLRVDGRLYTVVGVMPAGFEFPAGANLWVPAELDAENTSRTAHNWSAIGRLRDQVRPETARADLSRIAQDIIRRSPERNDYLMADATAEPLQASLTGQVGSTLYVLLGAVFFLLLVACANVTNLLLAQASARQRELAIRHALGAGRGRLVRQFVLEALVLLGLSGLAGLGIAWVGLGALLALAPPSLPRLDTVSLSWPILSFAVALSALVALVIGLLTALRATRRDPRDTLGDNARGQAGRASGHRVGHAIVAGQTAITVVLLVGAALLGRSLLQVLSVNPGFRTDGIVAMDLPLPYSDDEGAKARLVPLYGRVFDRLRAIPGVSEVAAVSAVPMDGGLPDGMFVHLNTPDVPKKMDDLIALFQHKELTGTADFSAASPAYFRVLGIPLVRGRLFDDRDRPDAPHVAVISASLARSEWAGVDPLGRLVEFGNMDGDLHPIMIVGIVGDTHEYGLEQPARPTLYVNLLQRPRFGTTVVLRTTADLTAVTSAARAVLHDVAPDVPPRFRTFQQIYAASLGARQFNLTLVGVFAATALLLAIAGIYGVMAYSVSQRRREIGVRMALGATPTRVFRTVLGEGLFTTIIGVAIGLAGARALTRTLSSLLFGVTPTDPMAFAAVVLLLVVVATLACYLPARRATATDPMEALRQE